MRVSAVLLARAIAFFEVAELAPTGRVFVPALVSLVVKKFNFQSYPSKLEDFDASKGITFKAGIYDGLAIEELAIYNDGIKVDLTSSTRDAKRIVHEALEWLAKEVGIAYSEEMIHRWGLLSQLIIEWGVDFDGQNNAFKVLGEEVTSLVSKRAGMHLTYKSLGVSFGFDRSVGDIPIANFVIERRAKRPFTDNKYFSQAPLETDDHIRILQDFERNLGIAQ